jgi:hypothetical protein
VLVHIVYTCNNCFTGTHRVHMLYVVLVHIMYTCNMLDWYTSCTRSVFTFCVCSVAEFMVTVVTHVVSSLIPVYRVHRLHRTSSCSCHIIVLLLDYVQRWKNKGCEILSIVISSSIFKLHGGYELYHSLFGMC